MRDILQELQKLPEDKKKVILWAVVVLLAIVLGALWVRNSAVRLSEAGKKISQQIATIKPPQELQKLEWKTCKNDELGMEFDYPANLGDVEFKKHTEDGAGAKGLYFEDLKQGAEYGFAIFQKGFNPFPQITYSKQRINQIWDKQTFIKKTGVPESLVLETKKLGEKSLLVLSYSDYECSPYMQATVLAPFSEQFPNLEIYISLNDADYKNQAEEILKQYEEKQVAKTGDACDMRGAYEELAGNIMAGKYPGVDAQIETAGKMAESLRKITP